MPTVVNTRAGKEFEKPDNGIFHGVLADVVDLGMVSTSFQGKVKILPMVRLVWILNVNGKDGKPLSVAPRYNANLHERSRLYKMVRQIINAPPPVSLDLDTLIGQTRQLLIVRAEKEDGNVFANVEGVAPAQPGIVVQIPPDFIRSKDRPKTAAGPAGAPVQTYASLDAAKAAFAAQQNTGQSQAQGFYKPPPPPSQQQGPDIKF